MAIRKTEGVILRTLKMGETSKLLTLFTRDAGILKLIAKGARRSRSRIGGILQPLYAVEVVYYEKESRELQILSQASLIFAPAHISADLQRFGLASACCELITRLEKEKHPNPAAYGLLRAAMEAFDRLELEPRVLFLAFQARLLEISGLSPGLDRCSSCGKEDFPVGHYDFLNGRLFCATCAGGGNFEKELQRPVIHLYRRFVHAPLAAVAAQEVPNAMLAQLYRFLVDFSRFHLEEALKLRAVEVLTRVKLFNGGEFLNHDDSASTTPTG